jgi:hypothetical protein
MREFILAREQDGAWQLLLPTKPGALFALVAFGDAFWDDFDGRWTRPDPEDFAMAERTFSILRGGNRSLTAMREVR